MNWIGWAMWWVASAASSASPAADVGQSGAAQGEPINQKATEAAGLDEDDEIVLDEEPAASSASAESEEIVLEEEPTQDKPSTFRLPPPAFKPSTIVRTRSETSAAVDTAHQEASVGSPEDVLEAWSTLRLQLIHRGAPGRSWRVGARLRLWGGWDHPDEGGAAKTALLTELTELRYDRRVGADTVLQFGLQKVDWSFTDGMGPSVMFAPRDLRFGLAGEAEDMSLPVEAIAGRHTLSYTHDLHLDFAFVPRHRPLEMRLWGNDWGTASPDAPASLPIGDIAWLFDRSVEDQWQSNLLYFAQPELTPEDFSGSVRLRGRVQGAEVALWGFYGFDTFPEFKMDPDLAAVLSLITMMGETPLIEQLTPERLEALERFQGKLMQARAQNDGSSLLTSTFHRLAQLGVQARRSFGPYVLALESAWTPRFMGGRTLFDLMMQPIPGLATLHTALQVEYQSPPGLVAVLGVSDFAVFDVPNKPLMLLDTGFLSATGQLERPLDVDNAHLVTINLGVKSTLAERFEVTLAGALHPFDGDWLALPSLAWLLDAEREQLVLGAEIFGGSAQSMFGRYRHNDRVTIGYKRSY